MAQLTPIKLGPNAGFTDMVAQLAAVAGGGDSFYWTGREIIVLSNGNASTCTLTLTASQADNFGVVNAAHNLTLAVPTTKIGIFSPVSGFRFPDSNNLVQLSYSVSSTVTIGIFVISCTG